jgi:hypothetical protein
MASSTHLVMLATVVVPSLYQSYRACRNREERNQRLLGYRIADLVSFKKDVLLLAPTISKCLGRIDAIQSKMAFGVMGER